MASFSPERGHRGSLLEFMTETQHLKITARARIQITIEMDLGQPWSAGTTVGEVYRRAGAEACEKMRCVIQKIPEETVIIGQPKIIGVFTNEAKE